MPRRRWERYATGGLLILIGILLLLWTTEVIEGATVWSWVPALFVILGVWALVRSGFRNIVGPVMLIAVAGTFFLRAVGLIEAGVIGTWWPLFIVLFGVLVVLNRSQRRRHVGSTTAAGSHDAIAIFGTIDRRLDIDDFAEAEVVAIFGDARFDVRDSTVRHPPAIVDVASVFGDVELLVPESWNVSFEVMSIFGDVDDRRPHKPKGAEETTDLVVSGVALFGDVEVRD